MKKNEFMCWPWLKLLWSHKLFRIMRLSVLLMIIGTLHMMAAPGYSQYARLSFQMEDVAVKDVLDEIESNSEFYFLYSSKLIDVDRKVSIKARNDKINQILASLFRGEDVEHYIVDRQIILSPGHLMKKEAVSKLQQQLPVSGTVTDAETGEPLPGVNILIQGTNKGATTDMEGSYEIEAPADATLSFSFVGYQKKTIDVRGREQIDVALRKSITELEEVVAIGYGTAKKSDLTGSVGSADPEEVNNMVLTNPAEGMRGKVSGVLIQQSSAQPGGGLRINIRGVSSIAAGSEPLFVVDGVPSSYQSINPTNIESIEVLKDASATAVYGSRGSGGVVLITTKEGKTGDTEVSFESYLGTSQMNWKFDLMNIQQSVDLINAAAEREGMGTLFSPEDVANMEKTDWVDLVTQNGFIQNYNLSFDGGTEAVRYRISAMHQDQQGVVLNTGYRKTNLRANFNFDVSDKFDVFAGFSFNRENENRVPEGAGNRVLMRPMLTYPWVPVRTEDGEYFNTANAIPGMTFGVGGNRYAELKEREDANIGTGISANLQAEYQIIPALSYKLVLSGSNNFRDDSYFFGLDIPPSTDAPPDGRISLTRGTSESYNNQNILTFDKDFGDHTINATGLFEWFYNKSNLLENTATGFFTDELGYNLIDVADSPDPPHQWGSESSIASFMGRINYNYLDRYLLTFSYRADGSSKFGEDNKWGYFPSAAFAWRLSNEEFIQSLGLFSNLKLRLSWGQVGNQSFGSYNSLIKMNVITTAMGNQPVKGVLPQNLPNEELKWEVTTSSNVGLDFGFFDNRLSFNTDYYIKNTSDLLSWVPIAQSTGYTTVIKNIGEIQNRGFELGIGATILDGNFFWKVNGNISHNVNEVISLAGDSPIYGSALSMPLGQMHIVKEGHPIPSFWAYEEEPKLNENGQIVIKDIKEDGVINEDDKTIQGSPRPDYFYGLTNTFSYKGFDLSVFIQGVQGNEIISGQLAQFCRDFPEFGHRPVDMYENRWTPENPDPNAEWPRMDEWGEYLVDYGTNRFIMDGSYLRLKNVRLAYNIPAMNFTWLKSAQIYFSADNLVTLTNYKYFDPEISTHGSTIRDGVDLFSYPNSRRYVAGLKVTF